MSRKSSKPLFFLAIAIIAICAIGAVAAAVFAWSQGKSLVDLITGGQNGAAVVFSLTATLLEDNDPVGTYDPTAGSGGPLSFLNWFSIVFTGYASTTSDDVILDNSLHSYAIQWSPRIDTTANVAGGSSASVVVTITKAEYQWKGGSWHPLGLAIGSSDTAADTWTVSSTAHNKALTLGTRITDLGVVFSDPPALGSSADLRIHYTFKVELFVDNVLVNSKTGEIYGIANFANRQVQTGTLSIAMVTISQTLQTIEVGTP
jgi:hypothetical protein